VAVLACEPEPDLPPDIQNLAPFAQVVAVNTFEAEFVADLRFVAFFLPLFIAITSITIFWFFDFLIFLVQFFKRKT